jgi:aminocarboxymuconate-semialdehyde decarboxylase
MASGPEAQEPELRGQMADIWNKYEPTAARRRGTPGKQSRPKSTTVDMHAHVAIPRAGEIAGPHLDPSKVPLDHFSNAETKAIMAKQAADIGERIRNTDARFRVMDDMGVDVQLISPGPPQLYYTIPTDVAVKATQALNDGIAEYVGKHTDRLCALGGVPLSDGDEAVKELERCMKQLKFKGVEILTNVAGKELSDPAFAGFWKKAEELGALVMIHPNGFTQADRLTRFYFNNVIGNPLDTTIALHYLIFDGVLERRARRRLSRRLFRPHRPRLGRARGCAQHFAEAADALPEEDILRHRRVYADPARGAGQDVWRRPRRAGHRLSVRHGGLRPCRACGIDGL